MVDRGGSIMTALQRPLILSTLYLILTLISIIGFNAVLINLDVRQQWVALLASIALFGLPHGALDPLLAYRSGLYQHRFGAIFFALVYVMLAAATLWFWQQQTPIALGVFLAITAWHFSSDWRHRGYPLTGWVSTALLLGLPALAYPTTFVALIELLGIKSVSVFQTVLAAAGALALFLIPWVAIARLRDAPEQVLELLAIVAGGFLLPPLWFFGLYFCALHSPRHMLRYFAEDLQVAPQGLLLVGVAFSLPVIVLALWFLSSFVTSQIIEASARTVFAGLFALTVPHLLVVEWCDRRTSRRRIVG